MMSDHWSRFYDEFGIPVQEEDPEFEFANAQVVVREILKAANAIGELGQRAERLTEEIARFEVLKSRADRELAKIRRDLFARHYGAVTKSAGQEIQDAFVLAKAIEDGLSERMADIENEIEEYRRALEARTPRLDQIKARMKLLERKVEWGRQYVDFEKLIQRLTATGGRPV